MRRMLLRRQSQAIDPVPFIITIDTTQAGSASDTFVLPLRNFGSGYNFTVDWGDGNTDLITAWNQAELTHVYSSSGTYQVKCSGQMATIYFNATGDRRKVMSIDQWGQNQWESFANSFLLCSNMVANYSDTPDLSLCTNLTAMFYGCTLFNGEVGNWDFSTIQIFTQMFRQATAFNNGGSSSINTMVTGTATAITQMFFLATNFNQPIGGWDVSNVAGVVQEFLRGATAFNQNVGAWNIQGITDLNNFLFGVTISTANYDALLVGWTGWTGGMATKSVQSGVTFNGGGSKYTLASDAAAARAWLIATKLWSITDGGGI